MAECSLDTLLRSLQSVLVAAQEHVMRRHEASLRRLLDAHATGETRGKPLMFSLPARGPKGTAYETVPLPLASFREHRLLQISKLSLEFDCELEQRRRPDTPDLDEVVMRVAGKGRRQRKDLYRVQITFSGTRSPRGEVRVDGMLLTEIAPAPDNREDE